MKIQEVVNRFEQYDPRNEVDTLANCRLTLRYIGGGSFRNAYQVNHLPVVAKFPLWRGPGALEHARKEISIIRTLWGAKYKELHCHLPHVYYSYPKTGVIVMRQYGRYVTSKDRQKEIDLVGAKFADLLGIKNWDYFLANFGMDKKGQAVVIDLGCLDGCLDSFESCDEECS